MQNVVGLSGCYYLPRLPKKMNGSIKMVGTTEQREVLNLALREKDRFVLIFKATRHPGNYR